MVKQDVMLQKLCNSEQFQYDTYFPRSCTAFSQSLLAMAFVTAFVFCTHSIRGNRTAWLPSSETTQDSVSGVASMSAITASAPILHPCQMNTPTLLLGQKIQIVYITVLKQM